MMNKHASKSVLLVVSLAVLLTLTGCSLFRKSAPAQNENTNTIANENTNAMENKNVNASSKIIVNLSGQSGVAAQPGFVTIAEVDGKAMVDVKVAAGPAGVVQPAHIHDGTCANLGGVALGLDNVVSGSSQTQLDISINELMAKLPLAINVHKSVPEIGVYVACGDITANSVMEDDDEDEDEDDDNANMNANVNLNMNTNVNANVNANVNTNINANVNANVNLNVSAGIKIFAVSARNFAFDKSEIKVKKGDKVRINLTSANGFHDWVVDEFDAVTAQVNTGQSASVEFVADKTGTFEFYCSVGSHRAMGMKGKLIVE